MSKRIEVSTIIEKPIEVVWDEVKIMKNHVNIMNEFYPVDNQLINPLTLLDHIHSLLIYSYCKIRLMMLCII